MITIRPLTVDDAEIIVGFNENTSEDFFNQWGGGRFYKYPLTKEQIIERMQNTENTRYFAALLDGTVIGMAELDFINWDEKICFVCRFILGEEYRNKGYGVKFLNLLCNHAADELGMKKVKLGVFDFNAGAYKCYLKAGFKVIGEAVRPNGWKAIEMEYTPLLYRKATVTDIELLTTARVEFFGDIHKNLTDEEKIEIYDSNREYFEETLTDGRFIAFLAFDDDVLVGTSGVSFYRTPPNLRNKTETAYIANMFTKQEYRGRGIATKLFAMTLAEAKKRGCGKAVLHATDMGKPIYEKFGFFVPNGAMEYYF